MILKKIIPQWLTAWQIRGPFKLLILALLNKIEHLGDSFWADGYFAETIGAQNFAVVEKYIRENVTSRPPGR